MNCPNCRNEMVNARATNFGDEYLYCRSCKKELVELLAATKLETSPAPLPETVGGLEMAGLAAWLPPSAAAACWTNIDGSTRHIFTGTSAYCCVCGGASLFINPITLP